MGDCADLPDEHYVEYVRIYLKEGEKAVKLYGGNFKPTSKIQVCSWPGWGDGDNVYADYYPGATYSWQTDPAIEINADLNQKTFMHFWAAPKPNITTGTYPCTLTVTFASGYQEVLNLNVEVVPQALPAPVDILLLNAPPTFSYPIGVVKQPGTTGYEWSDDAGSTWVKIPNNLTQGSINRFAVEDPISYTEVDVCVRAYNSCTTFNSPNPAICETIMLPHVRQNQFLTGAPFPDPITIALSEEPDLFELRTLVLDSTTSFLWSFDEDTWFKEENQVGDTLNRFGFFAPGTPPFHVFLRSEMDSELSEVYLQWVEIPDSIGQDYGLQQWVNNKPATLPSKLEQAEEFPPTEEAKKEMVEIFTIQGIPIWRGSFGHYELYFTDIGFVQTFGN